VPKEEFEDLMTVMRIGEKIEKIGKLNDKSSSQKKSPKAQKNTLMNYFGSK